jgi:hypothetical protein
VSPQFHRDNSPSCTTPPASSREALVSVTFDMPAQRFLAWTPTPGSSQLHAHIRTPDGREWAITVVSQGGAPAVVPPFMLVSAGWPEEEFPLGGLSDETRFPAGIVLPAISAELQRLFDADGVERLTVQAAGFLNGPRRHRQPGRQPDSAHALAVKSQRILASGFERASDTERGVLERARKEEIIRSRRLTEQGEILLSLVEDAKHDLMRALSQVVGAEATSAELLLQLVPPHALDAVRAALDDLATQSEIALRYAPCKRCRGSVERVALS